MPSGKEAGEGSDVGRRMLGTFLTNMQDNKEPIFWFFTANSIEGLNDAFTRAERIDGIIYVRLPNALQRADIWKIYLKKFFPKTVNGKTDPRYIDLDYDNIESNLLSPSKTEADIQRCAAGIMTMHPELRTDLLERMKNRHTKDLVTRVREELVIDTDWTPAEIKACCRLSRRLKLSLAETAKRIQHVCIGEKGEELLRRLDEYAATIGAIDSETGEIFRDDDDAEVLDMSRRKTTVRRPVARKT